MVAQEEPGSDEIYCPDCGEIIKKKAEICPECGVRQKPAPQASSDSESSGGFFNYLGNYYLNRGVWGYTLLVIDFIVGIATAGGWVLGRWGMMLLMHSADDE